MIAGSAALAISVAACIDRGVLMSSSEAVANGVVSAVRSKRPRRDYHSQEGGEGGQRERFCQPEPSGCKRHTSEVKVNYQTNSRAPLPRPSPRFKDYIVLFYSAAPL